MITFDDFLKLDVRVGKITEAEDFPEARKPSYKLKIDFGSEIGVKTSGAQITQYSKEELKGKLVLAVVNFPPKQIANFRSEALTLGVPGKNGEVVLVTPDSEVEIGGRVF
ncbi:tRNA-binding protein [Candidatus Woesearchaeota archaeon]|nr:tRNA-binding protein [Candidatus Woesearchaeota archaeon]